jgi:hypothetical protein
MEEFKTGLPEIARFKLRGLTGDCAKTNAPRAPPDAVACSSTIAQ